MYWLALIGLAFFVSSCSQNKQQLLHIEGQTMGTYYQLTYVLSTEQQKDARLETDKIQGEINKLLEQVNEQMSTYRPASELSRFNQATESLLVSPATIKVVTAALQLNHQSNGAFDVTVGPLVNLWGFGPDKKPTKIPSDATIAEKKQIVGSQYLHVDGQRLVKSIPQLYVDLSSIAKGYGVDVVSEYLQQLGVDNYLVDIGGELRASGLKPNNKNWTLAIERPVAGRNVQRLIQIGTNGIATSGDYRNYFEFDGVRYSHTIDPKTGKPITHKLASVTVIDKSCMIADGLATAITVLGPQDGLRFAKQHKIAAFLLVKEGDEFVEYFTPEFAPYLLKENE